MKKLILLPFLFMAIAVSFVSCSNSTGGIAARHDTADVFYTNPVNGGKGWNVGVCDPKGFFMLKNQKDSSSTAGKWDTLWKINIPDSARDPKTNKPYYDSARKSWYVDKWYFIDKQLVQVDRNGRKYKNAPR